MRLTRSKYKTLSSITISIGQIFFASAVAVITAGSIDLLGGVAVILELILSATCWWLSVLFGEKGRI